MRLHKRTDAWVSSKMLHEFWQVPWGRATSKLCHLLLAQITASTFDQFIRWHGPYILKGFTSTGGLTTNLEDRLETRCGKMYKKEKQSQPKSNFGVKFQIQHFCCMLLVIKKQNTKWPNRFRSESLNWKCLQVIPSWDPPWCFRFFCLSLRHAFIYENIYDSDDVSFFNEDTEDDLWPFHSCMYYKGDDMINSVTSCLWLHVESKLNPPHVKCWRTLEWVGQTESRGKSHLGRDSQLYSLTHFTNSLSRTIKLSLTDYQSSHWHYQSVSHTLSNLSRTHSFTVW